MMHNIAQGNQNKNLLQSNRQHMAKALSKTSASYFNIENFCI